MVQVGQVEEHQAESARVDEALDLAVVDRAHAEATLHMIVERVEAETGERFFPSLVRHLADALGVQYAFASEMSEDPTRYRTLAVWGRGTLLSNFEIPLRGTPCEAVLNGDVSHHPRHLQLRFPNDTVLVAWGGESYCGVPLVDSCAKVVGHLAIVDDKPMPDGTRNLSVMRLFAARSWAEIERNRVQSELREEVQAYRDLYEEAPVAYVSVGPDGRIRAANHRAAELFQYSVGGLTDRLVFDLYADTSNGKQKAHEVFQRFLAGQETRAEELECLAADGRQLWISLSVKPIRGAHGQIEASRSILVDITDRKRMEAAMRDSEGRLSHIVELAMDAIVTIAEDERIVLFNAGAEKLFRCPVAEAIGQPFGRFLTEGSRAALAGYIQTFAQPESAHRYMSPATLTVFRANAEEYPIESTISQIEMGGRNLFTIILRDTDERARVDAEFRLLRLSNAYPQEGIQVGHGFKDIVGSSPAILALLRQVEQLAPTDATVLIYGETGTGKELVAQAIHDRSTRKGRPLVKVNCGAICAGLVESELFGHVKGAFTGAIERRIGRFELADGGTIFLDEVSELHSETQVKLLRVLQEHEFEPVGSSRSVPVSVRVIAATNRNLSEAVRAGQFRADLFYRLNVIPLEVPPLRDRRPDIPKLVMFFLERFSKKFDKRFDSVSLATMDLLVDYEWPGNIRELQNVIERAVVLSQGPVLTLNANLPSVEVSDVSSDPCGDTLDHGVAIAGASKTLGSTSLEEVERRHILLVLQKTGGLIEGPKGAAGILGLNPSTLRGRIKKLGIRRKSRQISRSHRELPQRPPSLADD
jgi:PAS domain S-box-containing protein